MFQKKSVKEYWCPKCQITKYIQPNENFNGMCKACGRQMELKRLRYTTNEKDSLKAIKEYSDKLKEDDTTKNSDNTTLQVICPYCKSTDTTKISTISKIGSVFFWGLLSQKIKYQWHCNKCGSDF